MGVGPFGGRQMRCPVQEQLIPVGAADEEPGVLQRGQEPGLAVALGVTGLLGRQLPGAAVGIFLDGLLLLMGLAGGQLSCCQGVSVVGGAHCEGLGGRAERERERGGRDSGQNSHLDRQGWLSTPKAALALMGGGVAPPLIDEMQVR